MIRAANRSPCRLTQCWAPLFSPHDVFSCKTTTNTGTRKSLQPLQPQPQPQPLQPATATILSSNDRYNIPQQNNNYNTQQPQPPHYRAETRIVHGGALLCVGLRTLPGTAAGRRRKWTVSGRALALPRHHLRPSNANPYAAPEHCPSRCDVSVGSARPMGNLTELLVPPDLAPYRQVMPLQAARSLGGASDTSNHVPYLGAAAGGAYARVPLAACELAPWLTIHPLKAVALRSAVLLSRRPQQTLQCRSLGGTQTFQCYTRHQPQAQRSSKA